MPLPQESPPAPTEAQAPQHIACGLYLIAATCGRRSFHVKGYGAASHHLNGTTQHRVAAADVFRLAIYLIAACACFAWPGGQFNTCGDGLPPSWRAVPHPSSQPDTSAGSLGKTAAAVPLVPCNFLLQVAWVVAYPQRRHKNAHRLAGCVVNYLTFAAKEISSTCGTGLTLPVARCLLAQKLHLETLLQQVV